ncbi:unnamed protein product [Amoebophrya sp. A25]|nr:unnamed protein product [Amoebophrya sp. A25]|eukprot:GSA25T00008466001.1
MFTLVQRLLSYRRSFLFAEGATNTASFVRIYHSSASEAQFHFRQAVALSVLAGVNPLEILK